MQDVPYGFYQVWTSRTFSSPNTVDGGGNWEPGEKVWRVSYEMRNLQQEYVRKLAPICCIHDRKVVAPLKHGLSRSLQDVGEERIHDRKVVAPLKPLNLNIKIVVAGVYP